MESNSLRFQIDPTPEESQRACAAVARACLPPSRRDLFLLAVYAAVGIAAVYVTPATTAETFFIGLLAITATVAVIELEMRLRFRHLRKADPHAREPHFVEVSREGVRSWCAHIDARYPWRDFSKITDNSEFYLFVRPSGGSMIPKRLLDEAKDSELRARVREWASRAQLGPGWLE
jgi:hypothetical protein